MNNAGEEHGYQCFHCLHNTVVWSGDFDFADYDYEGEGVIHECYCSNCGAEITYVCPCDGGFEDETI